ncbi:MAG TPA: hypothetical protein VFN21_00115 [Acidimicrobiales bacterium]|nr:hypothetical protein [Acidimicrobiales bacterium]
MIANPDPHQRWRAYRCVGVVVAAALVLLGGMIASLPRADIAGALGAVPGEPGDPTVAPTTPGTATPSAAPTSTPSVEPTSSPTDAPATSSAATWDQSGSSDQSSEQWQAPSQSIASQSPQSTYDAGVTATTTPPMSTTQDLLVGPSTTRAAPTTVAPRDVTGSSVSRTGGSSDPKIWAIVAALGAVAVGLGVATVFYWRRTRPEAEAPGDDDGDQTSRVGSRRRSRYADLVVTSPDPQ